jgi:hypothetical protein
MPGTVAKAHGGVQPFAGQIHAIVIGQQPEVYIGMQLLELAQPGDQPADGKSADHAHGQNFAWSWLCHLLQRLLYALKALCHHGPQSLAFVGQGQAARQAAKQRLAQALFEIADVLADGGLRHMQLLCGAGQAQVTGGRIKHAQGVQW